MSKLTELINKLEAAGLDYSINVVRTINEQDGTRVGFTQIQVDRPPPDDITGMMANVVDGNQDAAAARVEAILEAHNIPPKMKCRHAVPGSDSCNLNNLQCSAPACKTVPA